MIALTRKTVNTLPFSHYLLIPSLKIVNVVVYLPSVMIADINGKNRYGLNVFRLNSRLGMSVTTQGGSGRQSITGS